MSSSHKVSHQTVLILRTSKLQGKQSAWFKQVTDILHLFWSVYYLERSFYRSTVFTFIKLRLSLTLSVYYLICLSIPLHLSSICHLSSSSVVGSVSHCRCHACQLNVLTHTNCYFGIHFPLVIDSLNAPLWLCVCICKMLNNRIYKGRRRRRRRDITDKLLYLHYTFVCTPFRQA